METSEENTVMKGKSDKNTVEKIKKTLRKWD